MNIQLHTGHHFNWEYGNWIVAMNIKVPWIGIYMRINNPALNKIFYKLRAKRAPTWWRHRIQNKVHDLFRSQYYLGLVARSKSRSGTSFLLVELFSRPAPL